MTREEALRILSNGLINAPSEHEWCMAFDMAIKALGQEPKKGHWIEIPYSQCCYYGQEIETVDLECSRCKEIITWDIDLPHKPYYCENCDAKMVEPQGSKDKE